MKANKQEPLYEVIKKTHKEPDELIFRGSIEDCKEIEQELVEYHRYDGAVSFETTPVLTPEYGSRREFWKEHSPQPLLKKAEKDIDGEKNVFVYTISMAICYCEYCKARNLVGLDKDADEFISEYGSMDVKFNCHKCNRYNSITVEEE